MIRPATLFWNPVRLLIQLYLALLALVVLPLCYWLLLAIAATQADTGIVVLCVQWIFPPIALWVLWRGSGIGLLVAVQLYTILLSPFDNAASWMLHLLLDSTCLLGAAMLYRLEMLRQTRGPMGLREFLRQLRMNAKTLIQSDVAQFVRPLQPFARQCVWLGLMTTVCVIAAGMLFAGTMPSERSDAKVGLLPKELQAIILGTILTLTFIVSSHLLGYWRWRQLTAAQARIYIRSFYASWLEPDLRLFSKYQAMRQTTKTVPSRWRLRRDKTMNSESQ